MRLSHIFLISLVVLVWGLNFIAIKLGLSGFPPIFLCFLRMFFTCFPAIFFIKFPETSLRLVVLYGLFMFALPFSLLFLSLHTGFTPGFASLVLQMQTFFTVLLAIFLLGERLNGRQIGAMLLSFSGIGIAGLNINGTSTLSGFFMLLGAAFCWGIGNLSAKKIGKVNILALVIWGSLFTLPFLLSLSLLVEGSERILLSMKGLTFISAGSIAYIVYASTLFGYGVWSWMLSRYRLPTIAPFTLMVPIIALTSSALFTGEPIQSWKLCAAFLIITGLCINLSNSRTEISASEPP